MAWNGNAPEFSPVSGIVEPVIAAHSPTSLRTASSTGDTIQYDPVNRLTAGGRGAWLGTGMLRNFLR